MTLRELLKETPYKSVFNTIYKLFYQEKKYLNSKIIEADLAYSKVCKILLDLPEKKVENNKIYIGLFQRYPNLDILDMSIDLILSNGMLPYLTGEHIPLL